MSALLLCGADVVRGDLSDGSGLGPALTGVSAVITTATAITRMLAGAHDLSFEAVDRDGNAALVRAAEAAGVERFLFVSMAGLSPAMVARSAFAAGKHRTEAVLRASPVQTVIVRPAPFDEVWLTAATGIHPDARRATVFGRGRARASFVASDDVAEACVRLALADEPPPEVDLGGPEAMSRREVVAAYERATGARFRRIPVPRTAMRAGNRLLRHRKPALSAVMGLALTLDEEGCEVGPEPLRQLGIEPRSATDFIAAGVADR